MGLYSPARTISLDWSLPGATLTTHLYNITGPGAGTLGIPYSQEAAIAAGSAALLMVILLVFNFAARNVGNMVKKRLMAE